MDELYFKLEEKIIKRLTNLVFKNQVLINKLYTLLPKEPDTSFFFLNIFMKKRLKIIWFLPVI